MVVLAGCWAWMLTSTIYNLLSLYFDPFWLYFASKPRRVLFHLLYICVFFMILPKDCIDLSFKREHIICPWGFGAWDSQHRWVAEKAALCRLPNISWRELQEHLRAALAGSAWLTADGEVQLPEAFASVSSNRASAGCLLVGSCCSPGLQLTAVQGKPCTAPQAAEWPEILLKTVQW